MKILHVIDHLKRYNGMVHAAVDLACQQVRDGHVVLIWSSGGDLAETAVDNDVIVIQAPSYPALLNLCASMSSMRKAIWESKPEIIHAHMARSALLAWILSRLLRITLITSVQNSSMLASFAMIVGDGIVTGCGAVKDKMLRRGVPARKLRAVLNGTIGSVRFAHRSST